MALQTLNNSIINTTLPINELGLIESITNPLYQSTFLPIFRNAELEIKRLVVFYFYFGKSPIELRARVDGIIAKVIRELPKTLKDRDSYINGLIRKTNILLGLRYKRATNEFLATKSIFLDSLESGVRKPIITNPAELVKAIEKTPTKALKIENIARYKAKGTVNVENYPQKIKEYIGDVAKETMTTSELGKKPISLWQKAELDIRHENQMEKLQELLDKGVTLAYLSSHADSSKRCSFFQGELVSLTEHAPNPQRKVTRSDFSDLKKTSYRIRKQDGKWVYSLPDIMATETRGGWNNMIYCGFNCRHRLIPYEKGITPVEKFSEKDMKRERAINTKCRELERQIRELRTQEKCYKGVKDFKEEYIKYKTKADKLTIYYKKFCENNGFAWYQFRI